VNNGPSLSNEFKGIFHSMHVKTDDTTKDLHLPSYTDCPNLAGYYGLNAMDLSKYQTGTEYENWESLMHSEPNDLVNTNLGTLISTGTTVTTS